MRTLARRGARFVPFTVLGVVAALVADPVSAAAQSTGDSVGLRIGPDGAAFVAQAIPALLPSSLMIPNIDKTGLLMCAGGTKSIDAHVSNANADLQINSLDFGLFSGQLAAAINLSLAATAHINVTNFNACSTALDCDVGILVDGAGLEVYLAAAVDANGALTMSAPKVDLMLDASMITIDVSACPMADQLTGFLTAVKNLLVDHYTQPDGVVDNFAKALLPPIVAAKVNEVANLQGNLLGFNYSLGLGSVTISPDGLDLGLALGISYDSPEATCNGPAPATTPPPASMSPLLLPLGPDSPFVIGVSTAFLDDAVGALWKSGLLCIDDTKVAALGFDLSTLDLGTLIPGIPMGTTLGFKLQIGSPPLIGADMSGMASATSARLLLTLTGATLTVELKPPTGMPSTLVLETDATIGADIDVDPTANDLGLQLGEVNITRLTVGANSDKPDYTFDPARLQQIITDVALPLATSKLGRLQLTGASFGLMGFVLGVDKVVGRPEGIYVGISAFQAPTDDTTPPVASIDSNSGPLVRAGVQSVGVSATDDKTPPNFARFAYTLDGAPETKPGYSRSLQIPVTTAGNHVLQVVALDLSDNRSDPVTYNFEVDPTPPILTLNAVPGTIYEQSSATITFDATDNRSAADAITYSWTVVEHGVGGDNMLVNRDFGPKGDIVLNGLNDGSSYDVTVTAKDEAGNINSQTASFAVHLSGGCAQAERTTPLETAGGLGLLLALAVGLWAIRRARRVTC